VQVAGRLTPQAYTGELPASCTALAALQDLLPALQDLQQRCPPEDGGGDAGVHPALYFTREYVGAVLQVPPWLHATRELLPLPRPALHVPRLHVVAVTSSFGSWLHQPRNLNPNRGCWYMCGYACDLLIFSRAFEVRSTSTQCKHHIICTNSQRAMRLSVQARAQCSCARPPL
jgi:hypothetical protein